MRIRLTIYIIFLAITCVVAGNFAQVVTRKNGVTKEVVKSTAKEVIEELKGENTDTILAIVDSMMKDTTDSASIHVLDSMVGGTHERVDTLDSLHLAIFLRNKAIDDSLKAEQENRQRKNGLEAPVNYTSKDSLIYFRKLNKAFFFGNSNVKYQDMDLTAEKIDIQVDSNLVHATGALDTAKNQKYGLPVFVTGGDTYETDTMMFNIKTKKGLIHNVYTEQQDGFLLSAKAKRDAEGNFNLWHGKYTTCDDPEPDFYLALSRAKVRPGKEVVFGPAYLVVQDVPLPLAIPYGFFPFSKSYTSGFIMPSYGDDYTRGFYLRDGGYYFAISDKIDLKLVGEIYTKGSWAINAHTNYNWRYKFSGNFLFSYQDTRTGDPGFPDFSKTTSFKIQWSHRQDSKANPYSNFSASVNFATSSYERSNLSSMYNPTSMTQSTRTSSVSWSTNFSSIGMTLSTTANIAQNMRDSTLALSFPDVNIQIARFYPFRRKQMVGKERWYEKIAMSYTGHLANSITAKEDRVFKSNLVKDWRNGMQHSIPVSASFTVAKYINVTPSFNFTDRTYFKKEHKEWDEDMQKEKCDTTFGFYNVYNWSASIQANTKLYGFFVPNRKIFGDKIQAIRHTVTPSVSFSYSPDFSTSHYGYYDSYVKTDANGNVSTVQYSPYASGMYGVPGKGKTGNINFSIDNNIEMKVKSDKDTTGIKKVSIIDQLGLSMSYNLAAKKHQWSDLNMNVRLKWWKNYTFSMNAVFATYAYELDEKGKPYIGDRTEYSKGRFGRFQGMSQNISYTLNPEKIKRIFSGQIFKKKQEEKDDDDDDDTGGDSNIDPVMEKAKTKAKESSKMGETDEDGYLKFSMPWSLTFSYGVTMREDTGGKFNTKTMRYPYKFTQNLNFSGNLRIAEGWNISFTSGYDFNYHRLSMTTASLARDLHCFSMSCSVVLAPYTSYNFNFRCNAATLADALKYEKQSSSGNAIRWY